MSQATRRTLRNGGQPANKRHRQNGDDGRTDEHEFDPNNPITATMTPNEKQLWNKEVLTLSIKLSTPEPYWTEIKETMQLINKWYRGGPNGIKMLLMPFPPEVIQSTVPEQYNYNPKHKVYKFNIESAGPLGPCYRSMRKEWHAQMKTNDKLLAKGVINLRGATWDAPSQRWKDGIILLTAIQRCNPTKSPDECWYIADKELGPKFEHKSDRPKLVAKLFEDRKLAFTWEQLDKAISSGSGLQLVPNPKWLNDMDKRLGNV